MIMIMIMRIYAPPDDEEEVEVERVEDRDGPEVQLRPILGQWGYLS